MRLLLDTHILIWVVIEPERLKPAALAALRDADNEILFSAASVWEIAIKAGLGRADFRVPPERIVEAARASGFRELPVTAATALTVSGLPHHHGDPFDRLLVAQAMAEPAMLYTADAQLVAYSELVVLVR